MIKLYIGGLFTRLLQQSKYKIDQSLTDAHGLGPVCRACGIDPESMKAIVSCYSLQRRTCSGLPIAHAYAYKIHFGKDLVHRLIRRDLELRYYIHYILALSIYLHIFYPLYPCTEHIYIYIYIHI